MSSSWLRKPTTSIPSSGTRSRVRRRRTASGSAPATVSRRPVRAVDVRPGAKQHLQALPRLLAAGEDDPVLAVARRRGLRDEDAVGDDLVLPRQPPVLRRLRALGDGDAVVDPVDEEAPHAARAVPHPAELAGGVKRRHERAARADERGQADRRRHRLVQVEHVEALALERPRRSEVRPRREHDVRKRPVRGDDHRAPDRDHVRRRLAVAADARVQHPRELARRVVSHDQAHVVTELFERRRLRAPRARRLHPRTTTRTGRRSRSSREGA